MTGIGQDVNHPILCAQGLCHQREGNQLMRVCYETREEARTRNRDEEAMAVAESFAKMSDAPDPRRAYLRTLASQGTSRRLEQVVERA